MSDAEPSTPTFPRIYSFGPFTLDLERACLLRGGQEIKLRPKSFELLRQFVEHPGILLSKNELIQSVWPETFVTEDSLVQCVRDIRRALEDTAQHYIRTVPSRGYIFEAQVAKNGRAPKEQPAEVADATAGPLTLRLFAIARRRWYWIAAATLFVFGFVVLYPRSDDAPSASFTSLPVPLTSYPGVEKNPVLSPDENEVAFAWNGENQDNFDIYVQPIGSTQPRRLTQDPAQDVSPAWSPDGLTIAFL